MKSYLSLAGKELWAQKITSILILIALILSGLMTTVLGLSVGILQDMRVKQAASLNGDRYATFHQLSKEQEAILQADTRLSQVGSLINVGYCELENTGLSLYLREYMENALDIYPTISKVKEGRLPECAGEVALPESVMEKLAEKGIRIGDTFTLPLAIGLQNSEEPDYEYRTQFTLCGILENNYIGYSSGIVDGIAGEGTAELVLPQKYQLYSTDFKVKDSRQFQAIVDDLMKKLSLKENNLQYNWILLDALGVNYVERGESDTDTGFSFLTMACILVGLLVLGAAGLVIFNVLKIAIQKRLRDYGTLRAIGGTRGQIVQIVSFELFWLCAVGIPVGLLLGRICAKGLLAAATGALNPELFLVNTTEELQTAIGNTHSANRGFFLLGAVIPLVFTMLAALPAVRYAAYVTPTVAMSGRRNKIKRQSRRIKKIRSFEIFYARLNLKRGRGRTAITILSLVMSVTVYVALQSFTGVLDAGSSMESLHVGDYAITNETTGITPEEMSEIRAQKAVEKLAVTKFKLYTQEEDGTLPIACDLSLQLWETLQIVGLDEERLFSCADGLREKDKENLKNGNACIIKNPISFSYEGEAVDGTILSSGETITVDGKSIFVAGIAEDAVTIGSSGFTNGVQILVSEALFEELTGQRNATEVYPVLSENADVSGFESWLEKWCENHVGSRYLSYQESDAQLAQSFSQIRALSYVLILFIGLIGVLNIINTVYCNIHTRIEEIGMQRAIGMSIRSLYLTFLWEGAYYGIIATGIGGVLGYLCTILIGAATTETLELVTIPIAAIAQSGLLAMAACLLATILPLRSVTKMDIVSAIETNE